MSVYEKTLKELKDFVKESNKIEELVGICCKKRYITYKDISIYFYEDRAIMIIVKVGSTASIVITDLYFKQNDIVNTCKKITKFLGNLAHEKKLSDNLKSGDLIDECNKESIIEEELIRLANINVD